MKPKTIIFDFDGVIADTYDLNWDIIRGIHPGIPESHYRIDHHLGNPYENPVVLAAPEDSQAFAKLYTERLARVHIEASLEALKNLAEVYTLHIVSSNSEPSIHKVLKETNAFSYFKHVWGMETHKSKVEKFRMIEALENISLPDAYFITDTLGDLKEAAKVSLPAFAVTFGYHPREILEQGNPQGFFDSWDEILGKFL